MNEGNRQAKGRFRFALLALGVSVMILAGCATGDTATPAATAAAEPTATQAVAEAPAEEATVVAVEETAAPTEAATVAAMPAETATRAPTAAATSAATETAPPTAATETPAATATAVASGPVQLDGLTITLEPFADGFTNPLYLTSARDGSNRIFVVEKPGTIRVIENGRPSAQPFLNITDRVGSSGSEQGLLGLAFPPDFATQRFFFVNYTDRGGDTIIARYNLTDDANVADAGSEFVVLRIDQPAGNHNGGDLTFGPDGLLWIGTGDGGGANDRYNNGQNAQTLLGKMLRLDVTGDPNSPYVVPQDNPWADGQAARAELWAIGLRNPWRYSFDRATGDLWIADVGQNQIEEINVTRAPQAGGLNYGWPIQEGNACFRDRNCDPAGLVQPVAQYNHGQDGCSVTGGFVYRGSAFPALAGAYIYGDYCSGRIWGLDAADPGAPVLLANAGPGLSSFGEDEAGELYITGLSDGTIRRITVR